MTEKPITPVSFNEFLNEKKFMGSKCKKCGAIYAPPRPLCIKCQNKDMEWAELKGKGKLATFAIINVPPTKMVARGYSRNNPYCSGVVELEEGPRISAQVIGIELDSKQIKVGMPLKVDFVEREEGGEKKTTLAFRPASNTL